MSERPDYVAVFEADEAARADRSAPWDPAPADDTGKRADDVPLPDEPPADTGPTAPFPDYEDSAARPAGSRAVAATSDRNRPPAATRRIKSVRASAVVAERTEWLVTDWVPRASITVVAGREGIGKSTIAVDIAARATRGDLDNGEPLNVAYIVTEDSISHTVKPRLDAAGADTDRVHFLTMAETEYTGPDSAPLDYERPLDFPGDYPLFEQFIKEEAIGLVILDAAKSVMSSKLNDNSDTDVRQYLEPMSGIATRTGVTFVGLGHHTSKKESLDPGKLLMGSAAWSQVPRSVLAIVEDKERGTIVMWNVKANLAPRIRTVEARIQTAPVPVADGGTAEVGRVEWLAERDAPPTELLAPDRDDGDDDRTGTELWLEDYLTKNGPCPRQTVVSDGRKQGMSERSIKRAFKKIDGQSRHEGFPRVAHWSLPGRGYTGTATQPPQPTTDDDTRTAVLDVIAADHPLTETETVRTVTELVKGVTREDVTRTLSDMTADGTIHYRNGKYTKPTKE